jgi:hypothetical protein
MYTTHNHHITSTTPHQPLTTTLVLLLLVTVGATVITTPPAHAQISLGSIFVSDPVSCPTNFYTGMTCFGATIDCTIVDSHIDNISLTIGYVTQAATPTGTIVFFTGGPGTASDFGPTNSFADSYVGSYMIVYVEWASAWEKASSNASYENILHAACRPATLLKWINDSAGPHPSGAMCAQGKSAGSAAIAYAMSWYGAGSYLKNVELLAGPVLSKIDDGCNPIPPTVSMCPSGGICTAGTIAWSRNAGYTSDKVGSINPWTGLTDCTQSTITSGELLALKNMSIVDGSYTGVTPVFSFTTKRHGWICAGDRTNYDNYATDCPTTPAFCTNNSSPQGYDWYAAATDLNLKVSGTNKCDGTTTTTTSTEAEGVDGTNAKDPDFSDSERTEIVKDMTTNCTVP